jgi:hypothetical protein
MLFLCYAVSSLCDCKRARRAAHLSLWRIATEENIRASRLATMSLVMAAYVFK